MLSWGELEGRIDAGFYSPLNEKITYQFPTKQLRQISFSFTGGTPDKSKFEYWQGNIPWASPKDIKEFYLTETEDHISKKAIEKSSAKLVPANSVLVVVRSGILIHTFPVSVNLQEVAINQDLKALVTNSSVLGKYLGYYFVVFNKYILKQTVKHSTTVQSVNTFEFERLQIPIPPIEIQQQIVDQLDKAHAEKKMKEAEAREKLASIDNLVLDALGITLPAVEENTLVSRIFFTKLNDITNGRLDTFFHTNYYKNIEKTISNLKIPFLPLKKVTLKITDGSHYSPPSSKDFPKKYVTVRDINSFGEINFHKCYSVSNEDFELLEKSGCRPEIEDVLFSKDGTIGKTHTVKETNDFVILSSLAILRPNKKLLDSKYLEYILKTDLVLSLIKRLMGGSAIQRIILQNLGELQIPIPPLEMQKKIAEQVEAIYAEAKLLREQGAEILKQAKAEVEKMILGKAL